MSGTHRVAEPAETLRRITRFAKSMGITRVANITGLDTVGVPVVAVTRPNSRSLAVAQGKGIDLVAAKVSGLMESIENFHAENICKPLILDTEARIRARGGNVLEIGGIPRCSGGSYDPDAKVLWVEGHEILGCERTWLPLEIVHADYVPPLATGSGAFLMTDSGIASGNHPLEATSHAICELVERDAVTLWQYGGGSDQIACRLALGTIDDDACRWALDKFERARIRVAVWEVTSDVGIPAFVCQITDSEPNPWRPLAALSGAGCHPCRSIALFRALAEAAQARLTVISGSRDDLGVGTYLRGQDPEQVFRALSTMNEPAAGRRFSDAPTFCADTIEEDVKWELECLAGAGISQVIVVDLTLREYNIPVVRVVIPGLEGIADAPGFVPGARVRRKLS